MQSLLHRSPIPKSMRRIAQPRQQSAITVDRQDNMQSAVRRHMSILYFWPFQHKKHLKTPLNLTQVYRIKILWVTVEHCNCTLGNTFKKVFQLIALTTDPVSNLRISFLSIELNFSPTPKSTRSSFLPLDVESIWLITFFLRFWDCHPHLRIHPLLLFLQCGLVSCL